MLKLMETFKFCRFFQIEKIWTRALKCRMPTADDYISVSLAFVDYCRRKNDLFVPSSSKNSSTKNKNKNKKEEKKNDDEVVPMTGENENEQNEKKADIFRKIKIKNS